MSSLDKTTTLSEVGRARATTQPGIVVVFSGQEPVLHAIALGQEQVIGREMGDGLRLPDRGISRAHAAITPVPGGFVVRDLGSHNGTFVDGVRVAGSAHVAGSGVIRAGGTVALLVADVHPYLGMRSIARDATTVAGPALAQALEGIRRVAAHAQTLLVLGETGTGKELAAAAFHAHGPHASGPRIIVNCATIPAQVAERLLFGAVRGAYSGASHDAEGYIQAADGGSLFFDEIGELDLEVQAKLLRVLETREVLPLGATQARRVGVHFAFATHRDLRARVAEGLFRGDLFFRISQPEVRLPPLRERREEIPVLLTRTLARRDPQLRPHARLVERCLLAMWPGNVRELLGAARHGAENAVASGEREVRVEHFDPLAGLAPHAIVPTPPIAPTIDDSAAKIAPGDHEPETIKAALRAHGGSVTDTARALGMHRAHLYRLMRRHGILRAPEGEP